MMNHWVFMRVSIYNFFVFWKLNIKVWLIMETTMSCSKWYGEIDMEGSLRWYCFVSRETVESCTPWAESPRQQVDLAFNVFFLIYFFIRVSVCFLIKAFTSYAFMLFPWFSKLCAILNHIVRKNSVFFSISSSFK